MRVTVRYAAPPALHRVKVVSVVVRLESPPKVMRYHISSLACQGLRLGTNPALCALLTA